MSSTKQYRDASVGPKHSPARSSRHTRREKHRSPEQPPSPERRRPGSPQPHRLAAAVSALLAIVLCIIMFVWALGTNYRILFLTASPSDEIPCCVAQINQARLNLSVDPCRNFSSYICSEEKRDKGEFRWTVWDPNEALLQSSAHREAYAGTLLSRLHMLCHAALEGRQTLFVTGLTKALLSSVPASWPRNASQMMTWMFTLSVQLRLRPIVRIKLDNRYQRRLIGREQRSVRFYLRSYSSNERAEQMLNVSEECPGCLPSFLNEFHRITKEHVEITDFNSFYKLIKTQDDLKGCVKNASILSVILPELSTWNYIFKQYLIHRDHIYFCGVPTEAFIGVMQMLLDSKHRPVSVAVMLYQAVIDEMLSQRRRKCLKHLPYIWTFYYSQVTTSQAKDDRVKEIFHVVREAINSTATEIGLIHPSDRTNLNNTLARLQLFLASDIPFYDIDFPDITDMEFGNLFVHLRLYEYAIGELAAAKNKPPLFLIKEPVTIANDFLAISPTAYPRLGTGGEVRRVSDLAVLGIPIAKVIWRYLIRDSRSKWGQETLSNFVRVQNCFRSGKFEMDAHDYVLATKTVLRIVNQTGWHNVRYAAPSWNGSYSQLFFIMLGDALCDNDHNWAEDVSLIVDHIRDFRDAFNCSTNPTTTKDDCFVTSKRGKVP